MEISRKIKIKKSNTKEFKFFTDEMKKKHIEIEIYSNLNKSNSKIMDIKNAKSFSEQKDLNDVRCYRHDILLLTGGKIFDELLK